MLQDIANKFVSKTTINEKEYEIQKLGGLVGFKLSLQLSKVLLPVFGGVVDGIRSQDEYDAPETFTEIALTLCDQINKIEVDNLITAMLTGSKCNGQPITNLDDQFQGEIEVLIALIAFALKENFAKVFMENPLLTPWLDKMKGLMDTTSEE